MVTGFLPCLILLIVLLPCFHLPLCLNPLSVVSCFFFSSLPICHYTHCHCSLLLFFDVQLKLCEGNPKTSNETTDNWSLVSSGLSALANMARDTYIRKRIADEQAWWETSVKFLVCISTLTSGSCNLLLLLHNFTFMEQPI